MKETCVLLVFLMLSSVSLGQQVRYKLIENRKSWTDADRDCRSRDGSLVVMDTHTKVMAFQEHMVVEPEVAVWTAAYRQRSPWVWIEGCFSAPFLTKADGVRLSQNEASECAAVCRDSTYAALKNNMCFCLEDMRDLLPLNGGQCDMPCPGSGDEVCGGAEDAVSLYSLGGVNGYKESDKETAEMLKLSVHDMSRSDWKNCVYILKHDDPVWITADCRRAMPFLCKIYRENGAVIEYTSPKRKVGSWMKARDMCTEIGGTLADLHANNMEAVRALPNHSEYWVGLYRNTSWAWHTDDLDETPAWCTSFSEDKLGEMKFKTESCSLPRKYVCQIPLQVVQAENSSMVVFLVIGSIVWILAIATGIFVAVMMKKRGCCRKSTTSVTGLTQSSYFDLDDESNASATRPQRQQHSYVNSDVRNMPTCSQPPPACDPPLKPGAAKAFEQHARFQASNGNEYASVCMSKPGSQVRSDATHVTGACASGGSNRGSSSTEGDYDIVWDSMKFEKNPKNPFHSNNRASTSSDNIYSEIEKVTHVDMSKCAAYGATTKQSELFPPSNQFGEGVAMKTPLNRTRSKSM